MTDLRTALKALNEAAYAAIREGADTTLYPDLNRQALREICRATDKLVDDLSAPTPDTIPWDAIHERWKWAARNKSGAIFLYKKKPTVDVSLWVVEHADCTSISGILSGVIPGTCDWRDSLQQRPEGDQ